MSQFNFNTIALYLTILLSIIVGCDCHRLSKTILIHDKQDTGSPLIVLFHGLNSNAACFDILKEQLKQTFPNIEVIALTSVEHARTTYNSIKEQANRCFEELLEQVPNLSNRPTLLIGHSQGGLRAYKMANLYKNELNVKGIITLATPWEGAPILNLDHAWFSQYLAMPDPTDAMQIFSSDLGEDPDYLKNYIISILESFKAGDAAPGSADLKPESQFLEEVKEALSTETIPILAIGAAGSDFNVFLAEESHNDFKILDELWRICIVNNTNHLKNDEQKRHDMIVPLYSQLASNCVSDEKKNFIRCTIQDAIHDEILHLPDNKKSKNILAHPDMFKKVQNFAESVLGKCHPETNTQYKLGVDAA